MGGDRSLAAPGRSFGVRENNAESMPAHLCGAHLRCLAPPDTRRRTSCAFIRCNSHQACALMERISGLGADRHPLGYTLPPLASVPSDGEKPSTTAADLPGPDPCAPAVLGPAGLRAAAALRHGDGCGDVPHGH